MTSSLQLTAFLEARLAEEEAAAKAAADESDASWFIAPAEDNDERSIRYTGPSTLRAGASWDYCIADRVAEHAAVNIARHDPGRVLREVAFKRAILGQYLTAAGWSSDNWPRSLRLLTAIWNDHPDYRQEWKP